ncbi:hypothetical protein BJAS_P3436 [Bathymodiolus japonicus methanotrophic gill symbiont]|uniref:hypothetical protein n=1 Tax=Bathymodiolus japonicus methanotrophic gill symbiont TaxID=113269 RepID=UPI001B3D195F|nr:hypothetical protein [Bathymodiolus japonicus methanotrophic gill symbiont]GFO72900.1 hypothetical protein BJAS_P3436 [Bathymodiolus japonicus methanotrophic gill symbiont]
MPQESESQESTQEISQESQDASLDFYKDDQPNKEESVPENKEDKPAEVMAEKESKADEKTEEKTEDKKEETKSDIPESYTLEDGSEFDSDFIDSISPSLKEVGINNEQFNKLAKSIENYSIANNEKMAKETMADPDFSGSDATEKFGIANNAIKEYGGEKLMGVLQDAGLLNNVEVIRAFHKIGRQTKEDGSPVSGEPEFDNSPGAILKRMYPDD